MVGMSIGDFFMSEIKDILLVLEGYEIKLKQDFNLQQIAMTNAIGINFNKKYKTIDPFEVEKVEKVKKISTEEKQETIDYLLNKFK